jgi:hypothetical protein
MTGLCECGCGQSTTPVPQTIHRLGLRKGQPRRFVSGHNFKTMVKSADHLRKIGDGQRRAWDTKRQRMPIGSKRLSHQGYILVKTRKGEGRWDKEHVLVIERQIGRRLFPQERVHHINAVRDDNRPENLYLCRSGSEHSLVHASFDHLLGGLLADGIVRFNRETGEYER